jgi:photosystem II stability/assembly factor-like uncharacterized protein
MRAMISAITATICFAHTELTIAQWQLQASGTTGELNSICFINPDTGWVVGGRFLNGNTYEAIILRTTNGGGTWTSQLSGRFANLTSVSFVNSRMGWAAGGDSLLRTTNGGQTWLAQIRGLGHLVSFFDQNTGYVVGTTTFSRTTDGGESWTTRTISSPFISAAFFLNQNIGFVSRYFDTVFVTTDGGGSWTARPLGTSHMAQSVFFVNQNVGWIVGGYDMGNRYLVAKTTDGGITWSSYTQSGNYLHSVYFTGINVGWAVDNQGTILKSTDGGTTWSSQVSPTFEYLSTVRFSNATTGWAVGSAGTVIKTSNGGATFVPEVSSTHTPSAHALLHNYPNPFNPSTTIRFGISKSSFVTLTIHDILGREVAVLISDQMGPGEYQTTWNATNFPSGMYFYRLVAGSFVETRKAVVIK